MTAEELLKIVSQEQEMDPDAHDGSYELMREIIASYSGITDYSILDYRDLNAIYAMSLGTWKLNVEKKKEYISNGHLPLSEKERLAGVIDQVWDKACHRAYENQEGDKPTVGMFGGGFYSFEKMADARSAQRFVSLMVDISSMSDDEQMYDRADQVFDSEFRGMQAASASSMLHCLKPYTFPVLNTNFGDGTIFEALGIKLDKEKKLETYISNCRKIKAFRDANLKIKNYRILDNIPRKYKLASENKYFPSLAEYDPGISKEQYVELLQDSDVVKKNSLDTIYYIYTLGGEATCTVVANKYGNNAQHYSGHATYVAKAIQNATNCSLSERDKGPDRYWSVLFQGRYIDSTHFSWKLREPLYEAIEELESNGFFDYLKVGESQEMESVVSKNTILYGPPGTGKTYNTVIYAVAIIEGSSVEQVKKEAKTDYAAVKTRYDEYVASRRIAFTTFHQSYGYEEFIEGIKPVMTDSDDDISYKIESGVFKEFCERASIPTLKSGKDFGIRKDPAVWKVSLGGARENPVRTECLENNHIRIGWDEFGPDIADKMDELTSGKRVLNAFVNVMQVGDIVLSCYSSTEIDAIGVIAGDCEWDDSYGHYKRVRKVNWIAKGFHENIVDLNKGYQMVAATVYWMDIPIRDIFNIVEKYQPANIKMPKENNERYVFIIDEINRGNISKIFGELITLIEETKRLGAPEEMKVELPYSHTSFGVPSNVYILGTMNTADRSIAIMDTALRRRFSFVEMLPESDVLRNMGITTIVENGISLNIADMLDIINERIMFLYDREHTIGHAFFVPLKKDPAIATLADIFKKSIVPLLQEYFYEDYYKIQLVLGDDGKKGEDKQYQFISADEMKPSDIFETDPEVEPSKKYTIQESAFDMIESYKKISKRL